MTDEKEQTCGTCGNPATLYGDEGYRCDEHAVWSDENGRRESSLNETTAIEVREEWAIDYQGHRETFLCHTREQAERGARGWNRYRDKETPEAVVLHRKVTVTTEAWQPVVHSIPPGGETDG